MVEILEKIKFELVKFPSNSKKVVLIPLRFFFPDEAQEIQIFLQLSKGEVLYTLGGEHPFVSLANFSEESLYGIYSVLRTLPITTPSVEATVEKEEWETVKVLGEIQEIKTRTGDVLGRLFFMQGQGGINLVAYASSTDGRVCPLAVFHPDDLISIEESISDLNIISMNIGLIINKLTMYYEENKKVVEAIKGSQLGSKE